MDFEEKILKAVVLNLQERLRMTEDEKENMRDLVYYYQTKVVQLELELQTLTLITQTVDTPFTDTGKPVLAVPEESSKLPEVKSISEMFQEIKAVVSAGLLDEDAPLFKTLNTPDGKPDYTTSSNLQNTLTGNVEPTATTTVKNLDSNWICVKRVHTSRFHFAFRNP